jgi:hypothetical protein
MVQASEATEVRATEVRATEVQATEVQTTVVQATEVQGKVVQTTAVWASVVLHVRVAGLTQERQCPGLQSGVRAGCMPYCPLLPRRCLVARARKMVKAWGLARLQPRTGLA